VDGGQSLSRDTTCCRDIVAWHIAPKPNSGVVALPINTPPAASMRLMKSSFAAGLFRVHERAVGCRYPAVAIRSLKAIGSPCRGPRCRAAIASSRFAVRREPTSSIVMKARRRPLSASIRSSAASTSSVARIVPSRVCLEVSTADGVSRSRIHSHFGYSILSPRGECEIVLASGKRPSDPAYCASAVAVAL
jgi:hypothetical protein